MKKGEKFISLNFAKSSPLDIAMKNLQKKVALQKCYVFESNSHFFRKIIPQVDLTPRSVLCIPGTDPLSTVCIPGTSTLSIVFAQGTSTQGYAHGVLPRSPHIKTHNLPKKRENKRGYTRPKAHYPLIDQFRERYCSESEEVTCKSNIQPPEYNLTQEYEFASFTENVYHSNYNLREYSTLLSLGCEKTFSLSYSKNFCFFSLNRIN